MFFHALVSELVLFYEFIWCSTLFFCSWISLRGDFYGALNWKNRSLKILTIVDHREVIIILPNLKCWSITNLLNTTFERELTFGACISIYDYICLLMENEGECGV